MLMSRHEKWIVMTIITIGFLLMISRRLRRTFYLRLIGPQSELGYTRIAERIQSYTGSN